MHCRANTVQQMWQSGALFECGVFYSRVFAHYFTVGFSLYSENKVIIYIFFPFINVHKCISVSVFNE